MTIKHFFQDQFMEKFDLRFRIVEEVSAVCDVLLNALQPAGRALRLRTAAMSLPRTRVRW